jgi:hypothetical protein
MKRYITTLFLMLSAAFGSHAQNAVLSPETTVNEQRKDTARVTYTYDGPHCTISQVYDKNGKALSFSYDDFEAINSKQKRKFKKK